MEYNSIHRLAGGLLGLLCFGLLLGGCNRMPDQQQAKAWFQEHKKILETVESELIKALAVFPYTGDGFHCVPAPEKPAKAGIKITGTDCHNKYIAWLKNGAKAERLFYQKTRSRWLNLKRVIGVDIQIRRYSPLRVTRTLVPKRKLYAQWRSGCHGKARANKHGSTPPEKGFSVGKYRVGWGLGQLAFSAGKHKYKDPAYGPQLDIVWTLHHKKLEITIEVNLLAKGSLPKSWRNEMQAYCKESEGLIKK